MQCADLGGSFFSWKEQTANQKEVVQKRMKFKIQ